MGLKLFDNMDLTDNQASLIPETVALANSGVSLFKLEAFKLGTGTSPIAQKVAKDNSSGQAAHTRAVKVVGDNSLTQVASLA